MIIDRQLAQRLEATDGLHTAQYAYQRAALYSVVTTVETYGDGLAVYGGPDMPINRVVGLGLQAPVTAADIDRIESFYQAHHAPVMIDFCPLADGSLLNELRLRRYFPHKMYTVMVCPITPDKIDSPPGEVETRLVEDEALWNMTVSQGFAGYDDVPLDNINMMYSRIAHYHADGANFIAYIEGEPAGAGASYINREARMVELYSGSTRVQFRRRGVQSALVQARLAYAQQRGCDMAMVMTTPDTASERNLQRLGFRVAYTKLVFTRD